MPYFLAFVSVKVYLDELWRFNMVTRQWAFLSGTIDTQTVAVYGVRGTPSSSNSPGGRASGCAIFDPNRRSFYVIAGYMAVSGTSMYFRGIARLHEFSEKWE